MNFQNPTPVSCGDATVDSTTVCGECDGNPIPVEKRGELVCEDCGAVIAENVIDRGPDWRSFDDQRDANKRRVGAPRDILKHDEGVSAEIGWVKRDANGNTISADRQQRMRRLKKRNRWGNASTHTDRRLRQALSEIDRVGTSLSIPNPTKETASVLQRQIHNNGLLEGRSIEAAVGASVYAACKIEQVSRTFDEIGRVSRVSTHRIQRMYLHLKREIEIEIPIASPTEFIPRFVSAVDATVEHEREAKQLLKTFEQEENVSGYAPSVLATVAIYAAGIKLNKLIPQRELSNNAGACRYSIRSTYREVLASHPEIDETVVRADTPDEPQPQPEAIAKEINEVNCATYI